MSIPSPEGDGRPLPPQTQVFRISESKHVNFVTKEEGKPHPGMFALSTPEKASEARRLSIWVEALTVADQAWEFMGRNPKHTFVACSSTDRIRSVEPPEGFERLDVVWEKAMDSNGAPNNRPGAEGHAGIAGLGQGQGQQNAREKKTELRSRLADIFVISPVPVPHCFTGEDMRNMASRIREKNGTKGGDVEICEIQVLRELRRNLAARTTNGNQQSLGPLPSTVRTPE